MIPSLHGHPERARCSQIHIRFPRLRQTVRGLVTLALSISVVLVTTGSEAGAQSGPSVPAGFHTAVLASGLYQPTALAVGPDHRVYIAQENGVVDVESTVGVQTIASGFGVILGLTWHAHQLYVSSTGEIAVLTPSRKYSQWTTKVIVTGLPYGKHQNDGLAFRGSWMYVGIGSTCNACAETDPRSATIMRFHTDGTHGQIYATGLRNPFGLAVRPSNGKIYATDNGRDDFGNTVPDELNLIVRHGKYGWPSCWGRHLGTNCAGTIEPVALFEPHSSADGIVFYSGSKFGNAYNGDAFVAEWGDLVNNLGTGHIVKFVHFGSKHISVGTFATGLVHPIAVAVSPSGSLLIADWGTGIVWRVFR